MRLTDTQTEFSSLDRVCILCSVVKMNSNYIRPYDDNYTEQNRF